MTFDLKQHPHRRHNPLLREWVLVSPQRTERPWLGQVERVPAETRLSYDPSCYLCPGNARSGGARNPYYAGTFVFDNDFPALLSGVPQGGMDRCGLIVARSETGVCRVLCFSPRHDLEVSRMSPPEIRQIVDAWVEQVQELGAQEPIHYVQIFENCGTMMGCSNLHPHCQIWANTSVPNEPAKEQGSFSDYLHRQGTCLLCDYLKLELQSGERVVAENAGFAVVVPFWAVWPFETILISRRHLAALDQLTLDERGGLVDILKRVTTRYDNLFEISFPYSMGFHQRPTDGLLHPEWHLHAHYYPPLLRSATVRKFMVGYEMLASPQRDISAEAAAERLREVSDSHYTEPRG